MLKKVLIGVAVVLALFLAFVVTRPDTIHVERSATIAAAPDAVFPFLNSMERFPAWSPWDKRDPQMKRDFSGPKEGVGSSYHWKGNDQVGEGRMTIAESVPAQKIVLDLDFIEPFPAKNKVTYTLVPEGGGTKVTWAMDAAAGFMTKLMCVFMSMDSMVGPDFEAGLNALKVLVEMGPVKDAAAPAALDAGAPVPGEAAPAPVPAPDAGPSKS